MKKSWQVRWLVAGAFVLAGLALGWWAMRDSGGTPGELEALAVKAAGGDPKSIAELNALGSNAVPILTKLLHYRDPFLRVQAWAWSAKLPKPMKRALARWVAPLEAASLQSAAVKDLGALGPNSAGAIPDLLEAMRDPEPYIAMQAAAALGRIGPAGVPGLVRGLSDTSSAVRHAAVYGLGQAGAVAAPAVPQLIGSLDNADPGERSSIIYSLSLINQHLVAELGQALDRGDSAAGQATLQALIDFHESLGKLTPEAKMTHADDSEARRNATEILGFIHGTELGATRALGRALQDPAAAVRLGALKVIGLVNWRNHIALESLTKCLGDPSAEVREWAARDLGTIGPGAAPALGDLKRLQRDSDPKVGAAAREAVAQIEARPKKRP